jgi:hypothetical protein
VKVKFERRKKRSPRQILYWMKLEESRMEYLRRISEGEV